MKQSIMAALFLAGVCLSAGGAAEAPQSKEPAPVSGWDNVKPSKIEADETEFLFKSARAMLKAANVALPNAGAEGIEMPKRLSAQDGRWVFLSFFAPETPPLIFAGSGRSIIASLAAAVENALSDARFKQSFASQLDRTRIEIDLPLWIERMWPLNPAQTLREFDPAAFTLFVKEGSGEAFVLPVQYFCSERNPRKFRDQFFQKHDVSSKKFREGAGVVFMATMDTNVEVEPGGLIVPLVRGNLLRTQSSRQLLEARARMAAKFLAAHMKEDGAFFSAFDPRSGASNADNYDMRRHCEAAIALIELLGATKDESLKDAVDLAVSRIIGSCKSDGQEDRHFLLIRDAQDRGDLGASACAAIALALYSSTTEGHSEDAILSGLLDFLVFMQTFEGDFRPAWPLPEDGGKFSLVSPFLGQAVCALIEGARRFPQNAGYQKAIRRSSGLMLARPDDLMTNKAPAEDAWTLRALVELSRYYRSHQVQGKNPDDFLQIGVRLAGGLAARQYYPKDAYFPDQVGGFRVAAVRLEGKDQGLPASQPAIERRLSIEPTALVTAGGLEGMARVEAERARRGQPIELLSYSVRTASDFLVREQYDAINSFYFPKPDQAVGGVRFSIDDPVIHLETMALFIRALTVSAEVIEQ